LIEQTKRQIRSLVQEIDQFSKTDMAPDQFYPLLLDRVVSALAAIGGVVWTTGDQGRLGLQYQVNLQQTHLPERGQEEQLSHSRLLQKVLTSGEAVIVPPHSGSEDGEKEGNPTDYLILLGALKTELEVVGVLEIFQRPEPGAAIQQGYLRFIGQMCDLAGGFLKSRQLRQFSDRQILWTQLEEFTRQVHASLHPRETAYTIANEGRRLIECDRVSVAVRRGGRCVIEAVSGQDLFDKRSNMVRLMGKLATVVVASEEPMWYMGDTRDMAPQVEDAVQEYVDETHTKMVAVLPLRRPEAIEKERDKPGEVLETQPPVGALIVEQIEDSRVQPKTYQRVDVVCQHSAAALANAMEHQSLFLLPVWRALGKSRVVTKARHLPKVAIGLALVLIAVGVLVFVPADFSPGSKGTLEPRDKRNVFALVEGDVIDVPIDQLQMVHAGDVLLRLRNFPLQENLDKIAGQLSGAIEQRNEARNQLLKAERSFEEKRKLEGDVAELVTTIRNYESQKALLQQQVDSLTVRSPEDGQVITWKPKERLMGRPVQRDQVLLTVAKTDGPWVVELHMPDDKIGYIRRAEIELHEQIEAKLRQAVGEDLKKVQAELRGLSEDERLKRLRDLTGDPGIDDRLPASFMLYSDPASTYYGHVRDIDKNAEPRPEEGVTVLIRVAFDKGELQEEHLQQGTSLTAKVACGRRSLGYVLFHDLAAWVRKTWFRFF
jgi:multidrug resistance efflux pump